MARGFIHFCLRLGAQSPFFAHLKLASLGYGYDNHSHKAISKTVRELFQPTSLPKRSGGAGMQAHAAKFKRRRALAPERFEQRFQALE